MRPRTTAILTALAVGSTIAFGVPLGELWLACRAPMSEACVWDKALLPASLSVGAGLGALIGGVVFFALRAWQERQRR